jgi:uncharacterized membrane protein
MKNQNNFKLGCFVFNVLMVVLVVVLVVILMFTELTETPMHNIGDG